MDAVDWTSVKVLTVTNNHNSKIIREAFAVWTARGAINSDGSALQYVYENLIAKPTVP